MGWVWKDEADEVEEEEEEDSRSHDTGTEFPQNSSGSSGNRCSTRKIIKSVCRTEEVEAGKFVRKCEKTEQILKDCIGRSLISSLSFFKVYGSLFDSLCFLFSISDSSV